MVIYHWDLEKTIYEMSESDYSRWTRLGINCKYEYVCKSQWVLFEFCYVKKRYVKNLA